MLKHALVFCFCLYSASGALARDWFATPAGAGNRDGSGWEDADDAKGLQGMLDQLKPGDRLLLGSGEFRNLTLSLKASGDAANPITIMGQDRGGGLPVFASNWTIAAASKGATAFVIASGTSHVVFRDVLIRGYQHCIRTGSGEADVMRTGWRFENVDMQQMRHGFYLSNFSDLKLIRCDLKRYSKHAFRFDAACTSVLVQGCTADCSEGDAEWEKQTEALPMGFTVNDGGAPSRNLVFEDCLARNNMMPLQKGRYKNGDGFVVEGNSEDVTFKRCRALRNQDGGFDLKVNDVQVQDCVAIWNKRDFRIWRGGRLVNCLAGWSQTGIWTHNGPVIAERCTIGAWKNRGVEAEEKGDRFKLSGCLLAATGASRDDPFPGATLVDCVKTNDLASAGLQSPPENWEAKGPALNSSKHPKHGYRARRD